MGNFNARAIREGLATALKTISGLNVYSYNPERLDTFPAAVVQWAENGDPYLAMQKNMTYANFTVVVAVGRSDSEGAQTLLDSYVSNYVANPQSIQNAIEDDRTLGGACYSLKVKSFTTAEGTVGSTPYLLAIFETEVWS